MGWTAISVKWNAERDGLLLNRLRFLPVGDRGNWLRHRRRRVQPPAEAQSGVSLPKNLPGPSRQGEPWPVQGHPAAIPERILTAPASLPLPSACGYSLMHTYALASSHGHRRRMLRSPSQGILVHTRRHPGTGAARCLTAGSSPARLSGLCNGRAISGRRSRAAASPG